MNLKTPGTLLSILFVSFTALATEPVSVPTGVQDTGGWGYWLASKLVLDIDQKLSEQGIRPEFCTFVSFAPAQEKSYKGLGPCLFENLKKSMSSEDLVGVIHTWIRDKNQNYHPVEIRWRPPRGGWLSMIGQVIEMRFEKPLYSARQSLSGNESANKLRYTDFIAGELNILLPQDPAALEGLQLSGNQWVANYARKIRDIDFGLRSQTVQEGKVIYQGRLKLGILNNGEYSQNQLELTTNINVLLLDRNFFLKGHWGSGEPSQNSEPLSQGALP